MEIYYGGKKMSKYDCLIVDDEEALSQSTCEYFNIFGIKTYWAADERACFDFLSQNKTDLILLDINLGGASGFEICKRLRKTTDIPILFISARTRDDDVLLALNIGGDDYIKKPYSLSVLLAKVKVMLKRMDEKTSNERLLEGDIEIDTNARKVFVGGEEIILKNKEFKLFAYLFQNCNKVISKEELFSNVWGDEFFSDGTLNVHIRKIREKIERNPNEPKYIKTVWGVGYIFEL
jgi:two-component system response regulator RegX3